MNPLFKMSQGVNSGSGNSNA